MVVPRVVASALSETWLPRSDHPVEVLLDRAAEPLDERIRVRTAPGQASRLDRVTCEACTERLREDRVRVENQATMRERESFPTLGRVAQRLVHPAFAGLLEEARGPSSTGSRGASQRALRTRCFVK